ncbi:MAG: hypothetical protein A3I12_02620 [Gammaproteobacteria bacterium RIFCSPLOWO2_02_FULL_38_11]|nr:MAG: hypothetical protein A3B69_03245 [Gammaproteobacteria bacterium RIFCSPHIGHO2_02_FULL_38_33]OGT24897.1 MAG: hypothetical protein A2W47_00145 [Gammaproteobacteria bacterium RIFCSPHIGHO2_12_38_15]OGT69488.1 MAG: hypothetical protein A3I12_02620 [Gammaproteobacteria bacterium RIFCSPLOWO2_02_FULL_38_11]OGT76920.1 MAG: hypothetical protein A3G71_05845 [Gammaproteobacteria bacterium RIFCSPLOWO2_12_FULL_38_14]
MVRRVFLENTFCFELKAVVTAVGSDEKGEWVRLDQTIFHPQGGGQKSDSGSIDGIINVTALKEVEGGELNHYVDKSGVLNIGQAVALKIDSNLRLQYAALHTAGHLLAAVVETKYPPAVAEKGHQFPGEAYYIFRGPVPSDKQGFKEIVQGEIDRAINQEMPVHVLNQEGRQIQVGEYKPAGCGGTHLSNCSQIAFFKFRGDPKSAGKGTYKLSYEADYKSDNSEASQTTAITASSTASSSAC